MRIKHSKYKNTGLIYELLVKQIAADTLSKKDSPAVLILKKFFSGRTSLTKEFKLYEFVLKNQNVAASKAETIVSTIIEISRKLNSKTLKKQKYELISELKEHYNLEEFFSIKVRDYKPLAALYCLLEAHKEDGLVDPQFIVDNKTTILEHLSAEKVVKEEVKDTLIEEYSKYDKDLKLLVYKILLEKFNAKYTNLLPEQKAILKEFITSVNSTTRLRNLINEEIKKISEKVNSLVSLVKDDVVKIKLEEVAKNIIPISKREKIVDEHLVKLMQYYDLVKELSSYDSKGA